MAGFNINLAEGFHVADVFWVDTTGLYLDHINFYAYQVEEKKRSIRRALATFFSICLGGLPTTEEALLDQSLLLIPILRALLL